jgi:deoxyribose-phosphate aldolase
VAAHRTLELTRSDSHPAAAGRPGREPRAIPGDHVERNPGTPLDLDMVRAIHVNRSAVERRAATLPTRRTVKKEWQAA